MNIEVKHSRTLKKIALISLVLLTIFAFFAGGYLFPLHKEAVKPTILGLVLIQIVWPILFCGVTYLVSLASLTKIHPFITQHSRKVVLWVTILIPIIVLLPMYAALFGVWVL